jgi:pimeloyl-ACP methyl ester carboxylesterase
MVEAHVAVQRWQERLTPVTVDGLRTWVLDEGLGEPVVFLHGIPTSSYVWRDVVRVVGTERRSLAPDLLGFGLADRPLQADLSPTGQAAFIERVLVEMGVDRYALVAHDYGALVAAEMLLHRPEAISHLTITNTSFAASDWRGSRLSPAALLRLPVAGEVAFRFARPFMLKAAFRFYVENKARLTPDTMAIYWHPFTDGFADVLLKLARSNRMSSDDFHRWRGAIYDVEQPALIAWGGADPTFRVNRAQDISTLLRAARVEIFDHANHFIQEDRPEALGRLILASLRDALPR